MICADPFRRDRHVDYPCGRCDPCRINRRRLWALRILLEANSTPPALFCTLTYADPCPTELCPRDTQLWLKRLRRAYEKPVRFFLVGEYGENTFRPHYHVALFGMDRPDLVSTTWGLGFVQVTEMSLERAMYIAGYTVKKFTNQTNMDSVPELKGRRPEFARMSNRPGIGALAMESLIAGSTQHLEKYGDVARTLRLNGACLPLGRYLRGVLRDLHGLPEGYSKQTATFESLAFVLAFPDLKSSEAEIARRREKSIASGRKARSASLILKPKKGTL